MVDSVELLRRYVEEKSEAAFAELVREHLGFVFHTALRHLNGDSHAAQDVAQAVFTDLARKAPSLVARPMLAGWLHTSTRYAALHWRRAEQRRHLRETKAHAMQEIEHSPGADVAWEQLQPEIDEALHALNPQDREAVLMRFFEGQDFAAIAARLELTARGAQARVERALDKMQVRLARRGVTSTAGVLAVALTGHARAAAPAGMAEAITHTALADAAGAMTAATGLLGGAGIFSLMKASTLVLAGSLAANLAFGLLYATGGETTSPALALATQPAAKAAPKTTPPAVQPLTDPLEIGRRLRAAGFSDRVVARGASSAVNEQFRVSNEQANGPRVDRKRRWNPSPQSSVAVAAAGSPPPVPFDRTPERLRQNAVLAELGYDASGVPFAALYRNLSAEKARAVRKLEDDYKEVREAGTTRVGNGGSISAAVITRVATEFEADIRKLLTPEEAADYFRYHSDAGRSVQRTLGPVAVSEASYAAIADAALAVERARFAPTRNTSEAVRLDFELTRTYHRELGDENFLRIAERLPSGRRLLSADPLYREAGLSPSVRAGLIVTTMEAFNTMQAAPPAERAALAEQMRANLTTRAGLSASQTEAFDATETGTLIKRMAGAPAR